jgi:hypothetical protein
MKGSGICHLDNEVFIPWLRIKGTLVRIDATLCRTAFLI